MPLQMYNRNDKMIEKKIMLGNLNAFYGQLLTKKQQEILSLYCIHDLSLGEIAENLNISRQAVYDTINRSEKLLVNYENKLKLLDKFLNTKDRLNNLLDFLDKFGTGIEENFDEKFILKNIEEIKKLTTEVLDDSF